jgi:hypothetical protein
MRSNRVLRVAPVICDDVRQNKPSDCTVRTEAIDRLLNAVSRCQFKRPGETRTETYCVSYISKSVSRENTVQCCEITYVDGDGHVSRWSRSDEADGRRRSCLVIEEQ